MQMCARAVVVQDGALLVMHRRKAGREFYALVGGHVEPNETPERAVLREVREESSLELSNPRLIFIEPATEHFAEQQIFLCEYVSGEPHLPADAPETTYGDNGENTYEPLWLPTDKLAETHLLSPAVKAALLNALQYGFPKEPVTLTSQEEDLS